MNNKLKFLIFVLLFLVEINFIFAQAQNNLATTQFNVCCEKTKTGAWCQNNLEENCDTSIDPLTNAVFRKTPTSCDATSYCKLGCCIDSSEGLCMENTPQRVCQESKGTWADDAKCKVSQCNLGCCVLGDQASFVTLTRCKKLSALYGLETNFRGSIRDEPSCVLVAHSQDKGACVYEVEDQKTCKLTTRFDCSNMKSNGNISTKKTEFFKDSLCSNDELATNCGPTTKTTCLEGKNEVYFLDSCGNPANIYDSARTYDKDPRYWKKIISKAESCGASSQNGNMNSKSCGNCDYFSGSTCGKGSANYGELICNDLNCYNTKNGNNYKNGESWCVYQGEVGQGKDAVGSRHYRHVCMNGEEIIEPCADFRNEVCIENKLETTGGNFMEAACRPNRWQSCVDQKKDKDCLNTDKRDCFWFSGLHFSEGTTMNTETGSQIFGASQTQTATSEDADQSTGVLLKKEACLPTVPQGQKFWDQGDSQKICSTGNAVCVVTFEKKLIGGKKCTKNCECLTQDWANQINQVCRSLGDCGAEINFAGKYTEEGSEWLIKDTRNTLSEFLGGVSKVK